MEEGEYIATKGLDYLWLLSLIVRRIVTKYCKQHTLQIISLHFWGVPKLQFLSTHSLRRSSLSIKSISSQAKKGCETEEVVERIET